MSNFKKHFGQTNSRNEGNVGHESKSRFHCSLPNSYKAHLEEVQHHSMACLQAMRSLCQSANDMAEGFTTLFQDTPFCEVATNLQHISQELASTTGEVCQHVNDNVNLQTSRLINRGLKEKTDESMQVMAHCFLLMLQTQCQFFNSASQIFEPLVRYQSLEDFFVGDDRDEILKEACSSWLSMSQMTKTLRRGDTVPIGDLVNLSKSQNASDPNMAEIKQRLDALILTYKYEFVLLPKTDFTMIGGFHLHPQCSALVLNGCCHENHIQSLLNQSQSVLEEMVRYMPKNQSEMPNQEELAKRLKANLHDVTIQVEGEVCKQRSKEDNFQKKVDLITKLISKTVKQNGLTLDVRLLTYRFLAEMCPQSTHTQSQIATHILFGRSNLVSIEQVQIENGFHNYVQVSSHGPLLIIEVPTVWSLNLIIPSQSHHAVTGGKSILGKIEVVYTVKFDVVRWSEGKKQLLPTIQVKLCKELNENEQQVVTRQNQYPSSQAESPISGLRKMFGKLNSKLHKKGSPSSKNSNFYVKSSRQGQDMSAPSTVYPAKAALAADQRNDGQVKVLVSPVVTITSSDNMDTSSNTPWPSEGGDRTKGFATDTEVQNIVDLLSGGHKSPVKQRQHPKVHPETLIVIANPESQDRQTSGWGTQQMKNVPKYGNFNPHYQEEDYSDKRWASSGIYVTQPSNMSKGVEHTGEHAEFAQYLAKNFFKKHGFTDEGHALSLASQWSSSEGKMNRTWPSIDPPGDGSEVSHSWPMGHDSGSSSDEDESACGDTYSMGLGLSAPGLMASVNRRRHSSGGEESLHIPAVFNAMGEPPALKYPTALLDVQLDPKSVRTWPPKNVWQRPSSPQPPNNNQYVVNQQEQLDVHRPLQAQWSDPLSVRHSNVWGPATGSTPVSPASSFTSLNTPQAHGQRPKSTSPRPHPRLDRKYAYNVHQFQSR